MDEFHIFCLFLIAIYKLQNKRFSCPVRSHHCVIKIRNRYPYLEVLNANWVIQPEHYFRIAVRNHIDSVRIENENMKLSMLYAQL
ncbi:MAG: hypothetical protein EA391_07965 [Balneolaceae bacterium]|nr:MAG: hypothetical protein EA391_07965 [Balneolaceae bacterium]